MRLSFNPSSNSMTAAQKAAAVHDLLADENARKIYSHGVWLDKARQVESVVINPDATDATGFAPTNKNNLDNYTSPGTLWVLLYKASYYKRTLGADSTLLEGLPIASSGELYVGSVDSTYIYLKFTATNGKTFIRYKASTGWSAWSSGSNVAQVEVTTNSDRPLILGSLASELDSYNLGDLYKVTTKMYANPSTGLLTVTGLKTDTITNNGITGTFSNADITNASHAANVIPTQNSVWNAIVNFKSDDNLLDINTVKGFSLTDSYQDTDIAPTASGTYLIELSIETNDTVTDYTLRNSDPFHSCKLVGIMSWYKEASPTANLGEEETMDDIILHRSGRKYSHTVYLATLTQTNGLMKLKIAASGTIEGTIYIRFKLKRIM